MSEMVSAFKFVLNHWVKPLAEEDKQEAYNILMGESLDDFLFFLETKGSIDERIRHFLFFDMFLYDLDDNGEYMNYYEEDYDKEAELEKVIFDGDMDKYAMNYRG